DALTCVSCRRPDCVAEVVGLEKRRDLERAVRCGNGLAPHDVRKNRARTDTRGQERGPSCDGIAEGRLSSSRVFAREGGDRPEVDRLLQLLCSLEVSIGHE